MKRRAFIGASSAVLLGVPTTRANGCIQCDDDDDGGGYSECAYSRSCPTAVEYPYEIEEYVFRRTIFTEEVCELSMRVVFPILGLMTAVNLVPVDEVVVAGGAAAVSTGCYISERMEEEYGGVESKKIDVYEAADGSKTLFAPREDVNYRWE